MPLTIPNNSNWKWPDIPGVHSFKGDLFHSATWDSEYGLKDKDVAIIGNGSSGIQIVSAIQPGKTIHGKVK